ncbi:MAG: hypothetical protein ACRD03_00890 [Acidimicrobiales bacterium]
MRDRRPGDWATDLGGRHRLEDEMAWALAGHPELVLARRATSSLDDSTSRSSVRASAWPK